MADDDGADSAEAAGREGAQLGEQRGLRRGGSGLGGLFGFLGGGNLVGDVGDCLGGGGGRRRHGGCELWWDVEEVDGEKDEREEEEKRKEKETRAGVCIREREEEVVESGKNSIYQRLKISELNAEYAPMRDRHMRCYITSSAVCGAPL